jgi:hypothetical protein
LSAGASAITAAKRKATDSPASPDKPTLILQVAPKFGFIPFSVSLYGRLEGVPRADTRFCHAGVEWTGETGAGIVMRSTEDARCIHPEGETRIEHSYTKAIYMNTEGIYRYKLTLHLNNGDKIQSNTVDVRAINNH